MTEPHDPEDRSLRPPMTARREALPTWTVGRLVSRATQSMPPRARARHFSSKGSIQRVRPVRSAAGGMRRVMVKVRVVPMTPGAKKALMTHVRYVAREGAGVEGEQGRFFDAREDAVEASGFARRCEGDRHHFRIIINPEDGRDLPDLKAFTRRFMEQVSTDMGTPLEWVAGEHYDMAVTFQQVQKYEQGRNSVRVAKLLMAAEFLKCEVGDLLGQKPEETPGSARLVRAWSALRPEQREAVTALVEAFRRAEPD